MSVWINLKFPQKPDRVVVVIFFKPSDRQVGRGCFCICIVLRNYIIGKVNPDLAENIFNNTGEMGKDARCSLCGTSGQVRPDIVWFGEMPYDMDRIDEELRNADLFVSIGTSGAVYPAAGFVQTARYCGAKTLEMNLEPSLGSTFFDESRIGSAGKLVPDWVSDILAAANV